MPPKVQLSKSQLATLQLIDDPSAKASLRKKFEAKVRDRQAKRQAYLERRNKLEIVVTDMGYVAVNGTGTRRNAIFSVQQGDEFLKKENLQAFREALKEAKAKGGSSEAEAEDVEDDE